MIKVKISNTDHISQNIQDGRNAGLSPICSDSTRTNRLRFALRRSFGHFQNKILLIVALLAVSASALAQDFYVIKAGNNFLAHTGATTIENATTFNAETCLWTISGDNIIAISPDGTTGNYLGYTSSGNNGNRTYSLRLSNNSDAWTDAANQPYVSYSYSSGLWSTTTRNFFPRYNNGWGMNYTGDTRATVTKLTFSDAPNTNGSSSTSYSTSLSGDDAIYSTSGTHTYTASVTQTITYAQTIRTFSGYANSGTTNATINKSCSVSSTYTGTPTNASWSANPTTYGNINASGMLTINSLPSEVANITITYTAQAGGQNITSSMQVMLVKDQSTYESMVVILDDREDHSWSYYSDPDCPIHSLNPADITIKYYGYGENTMTSTSIANTPSNSDFNANVSINQVAVNVGETENTFIYYKTLERANTDGTGNLPYTAIPNPFQVRPTLDDGSTTRTVYISWSSTNWTRNNTQATVRFSYTDSNGNVQTSSNYTQNGNTTIQAKIGTTITVFSKSCRNGYANYSPTITARYDNNSGTEIVSYQNTSTTENSNSATITSSSDKYRGFYAWRIKSLSNVTISDKSVGDIVYADEEIEFVTSNAKNNAVEFEALWAQAYVTTGNSLSTYVPTGVTSAYERNFHVVTTATAASNYQKSYPLTVTAFYPDGTPSGGSLTGDFTASSDTKFENIAIASSTTFTANNHYLCFGRGIPTDNTLTRVRGMSAGTSTSLNYTLRIESGKMTYISFANGNYDLNTTDGGGGKNYSFSGANNKIRGILGCDYDRAKKDNSKLNVVRDAEFGLNCIFSSKTDEVLNAFIKSGSICSDGFNNPGDGGDTRIYMGISGYGYTTDYGNIGLRKLTIEGGKMCNIAGGVDDGNNTDIAFTLRIKGGEIVGAVYGAAAFANVYGHRKYVLTGGSIRGWIAGGCNGTTLTSQRDNAGVSDGSTFMYIGGNTVIGYDDGTTPPHINSSDGGNVFGAGSGNAKVNSTNTNENPSWYTTVGQVNNSTIILSDAAYVQGNIYGGGNYGYVNDEGSSINIFGGTVEGKVFGGSNQRTGKKVDILMKGGVVKQGIYGGSNILGVVNGPVTMQINGGQVGTESITANIHGGGYGQSTSISGNVNVTLGECDAQNGVTVYGDVYGGSALGSVNTNANNLTKVTLNAGTIYGALYGGALGDKASLGNGHSDVAATVNGEVEVVVTGGSVLTTSSDPKGEAGSGSIFGGNNVNGTPQSTVKVDIYRTNEAPAEGQYALHAVYGGGNQSAYSGTPEVTIHGGATNSIAYVYGGGNAASVAGTNVVIYGGNKIGNVFGGGNGYSETDNHDDPSALHYNPGANVTTSGTSVKIHGGTILSVYGGSNQCGTITGGLNVEVESKTDNTNNPPCDIVLEKRELHVGDLYGGGNQANSAIGSITVNCMDDGDIIDNLYCGANQADVTGTVNFTMTGGRIGNLFGGNNNSGNVNGPITLTVNWSTPCKQGQSHYLGNVFGGGNLATYSSPNDNEGNPTYPHVNIYNGTVTHNVYGGGKGNLVASTNTAPNPIRGEAGKVTGNPHVTIGDDNDSNTAIVLEDVYGGGNAADVDGTPVIVVNDCETEIGYLYGGGNAADVNGASITINAGTIHYDAFGGGHGDKNVTVEPLKYADVKGNVTFNVNGGTIGRVFAGSNSKGEITGTSTLSINKTGSCTMKIGEVYGGGNEAAGKASTINIGCTGGLVALGEGERYGYDQEGIGSVYGGANQADIGTAADPSNIVVNITSGIVGNVYGGNNTSGNINGSITVNIQKDNLATCAEEWYVGNVFGGGNQAVYSIYGYNENGIANTPSGSALYDDPEVNILNGTVSGEVFGGGLGLEGDPSKGVVIGSPQVTINGGSVSNSVYGGGSVASVTGNPVVLINNASSSVGNAFGGGKAAGITGSTSVQLQNGTVTTGIYGGCYTSGTVSGNAVVTLTGGTVGTDATHTANVHGGGYGESTVVSGSVEVSIGEINNGTPSGTAEIWGDVYGGSALGKVNGTSTNTTYHTYVTLNSGTIHGSVYGGALGRAAGTGESAVAANVYSPVTVTVNGGSVLSTSNTDLTTGAVFGCNNVNGAPQSTVSVIINGTGSAIPNVYGGGNAASYTGSPTVQVKNGSIGNVFGGGLGAGAVVTGTPQVTIGDNDNNHTVSISESVFGGGDAAPVTGSTNVSVVKGSIAKAVYGGGNNIADNKGVTVNTSVSISGGSITEGVYGGCNEQGTVGGDAVVTLTGGTVGAQNSATKANVHGGGYGQNTGVGGNVTVNIGTNTNGSTSGTAVIYGDVYGGSALGSVNTNTNNTTQVNLNKGTIHGDAYGGGLGSKTSANDAGIAATVNGNVTVTQNGVAFVSSTTTVEGNAIVTAGRIFGCNNLNGSPQGTVLVLIKKTVPAGEAHALSVYDTNGNITTNNYELKGVYGGGNLAAYNPAQATLTAAGEYEYTNKSNTPVTYSVNSSPLLVVIDGCDDVSVEYVYGGGNAAATPSTDVLVLGSYQIGNVFGGGNGKDKISYDGTNWSNNPGADVGIINNSNTGSGIATTTVYGGTVVNVFGGSNKLGNIRVRMDVTAQSNTSCTLDVTNLFGGGNEAASGPGNITIGCMDSGNKIDAVYGGANQANITGDITLNIIGGNIGKVFGGNNRSGTIDGRIVVNINRTDESCGWNIDYVYGGGNLAPYTAPQNTPNYPEVNIINGTVNYAVFGGGLGAAAVVTGNPHVYIRDHTINGTSYTGNVTIGSGTGGTTYGVFGGGDAAPVDGSTYVGVEKGTIECAVYGGGNNITGNQGVSTNTEVSISGGTIKGGVYGGCNEQGTVSGNAVVTLTGGTVGTDATHTANVHGGGYGESTVVSGSVEVSIGEINNGTPSGTAEIWGDVYGGSALGKVNGTSTNTTYHTYVTLNSGTIHGSVYGGALGRAAGTGESAVAANVYSPVTVTVNGGSVLSTSNTDLTTGAVFGCNNVNGAPQSTVSVIINGTGSAIPNVYGGGNAASYTGSPTVQVKNGSIGNVFGGGLGAGAVVTGTPQVTIGDNDNNHTVSISESVFGGGDAAPVTGSTNVSVVKGSIAKAVYGGGNNIADNKGVTVNTSVSISGGSITEGVYGGCNEQGTVGGDAVVTLTGGTVGAQNSATKANVHGGGFGEDTEVSGDVTVTLGTTSQTTGGPVIWGDVYGGSALGNTNTDTNNNTKLNLYIGTIHGSVYGGGLGQKDGFYEGTSNIESVVRGNVSIDLNGYMNGNTATQTPPGSGVYITGEVFGCNNLNGTPKGDVVVHVYKTVKRDAQGAIVAKPQQKNGSSYELAAVYGGGNLASYDPSTPNSRKAQVIIDGCDYSSIGYVYGGGNAASVPATEVTVNGSFEIGYLFGGGNGYGYLSGTATPNSTPNPGANVGYYTYEFNNATGAVISGTKEEYGTGKAQVNLFGGTIHHAFGGSNTKGNVRDASVAFLDETDDTCPLEIDEIYGGGNEAYMEGEAKIELGCISHMAEIYGGARQANIANSVELTITSGKFDRVFGGNNLGGSIAGTITVNVEETGCHPVVIGQLYGGGNQAAYTAPNGQHGPTINAKSFTSIGEIFGGGYGASAVVTGDTYVNINEVIVTTTDLPGYQDHSKAAFPLTAGDNVFTYTEGEGVNQTTVTVTAPARAANDSGSMGVIGSVFGGGNAAKVIGETYVNIGTASTVEMESILYDDDNDSETPKVKKVLNVQGANVVNNIYGGGNQAEVTGSTHVQIGPTPAP